jgi:hypothetical protein
MQRTKNNILGGSDVGPGGIVLFSSQLRSASEGSQRVVHYAHL